MPLTPDDVRETLKTVFDPEIGINIVDLGADLRNRQVGVGRRIPRRVHADHTRLPGGPHDPGPNPGGGSQHGGHRRGGDGDRLQSALGSARDGVGRGQVRVGDLLGARADQLAVVATQDDRSVSEPDSVWRSGDPLPGSGNQFAGLASKTVQHQNRARERLHDERESFQRGEDRRSDPFDHFHRVDPVPMDEVLFRMQRSAMRNTPRCAPKSATAPIPRTARIPEGCLNSSTPSLIRRTNVSRPVPTPALRPFGRSYAIHSPSPRHLRRRKAGDLPARGFGVIAFRVQNRDDPIGCGALDHCRVDQRCGVRPPPLAPRVRACRRRSSPQSRSPGTNAPLSHPRRRSPRRVADDSRMPATSPPVASAR